MPISRRSCITPKRLAERSESRPRKPTEADRWSGSCRCSNPPTRPSSPRRPCRRRWPCRVASSLDSKAMATVAPTRLTFWRDIFLQYKQRKAAGVAPAPPAAPALEMAPAAPFVPGARNWLPLGPSVVLDGHAVGYQPVAGRVSRLAVAPGGAVLYAATANGGVFRSIDGGTSWRSTSQHCRHRDMRPLAPLAVGTRPSLSLAATPLALTTAPARSSRDNWTLLPRAGPQRPCLRPYRAPRPLTSAVGQLILNFKPPAPWSAQP